MKLQSTQPFGTLPEIRRHQVVPAGDVADYTAQRGAMLGCQGFPVEMGCQQEIIRQDDFQGQVYRKPVLGMLEHIPCVQALA